MPIINTLLTAKDNGSAEVNKFADNVVKAGKRVNRSFDDVRDNGETVSSLFNQMKDVSDASFGDIIDLIDDIKDAMTTTASTAMRFAVVFGLIAGGATAVTVGLASLVNGAADYVRQFRQVADSTNTSIEYLQQMKKAFNDTGFEIEKFGDINKDVLDHLGDAFRDGSGPADDMKALGLNMQDYNKYINQVNGGINALIHTYYQLRDAGKTQAEIINMMETLGSDGSHLIGVLKDFGTETEALNYIKSKHAAITAETAAKYKEWDNTISEAEASLKSMWVNALLPVVESFNDLLAVLNKEEWTKNDFVDLTIWATRGLGNLLPFTSLFTQGMKTSAESIDDVGDRVKSLVADMKAAGISTELTPKAPEGGWEKPKTDDSAQKAKQFAAQQEQARQWLAQLDLNITVEQNKADANYAIQLKKLDEFHQKKLISEREYNRGVEMLNTQLQGANINQIYQNQMERLNSQHEQMLISEQDYQERLHAIQAGKDKSILDMNLNNQMEQLKYQHDMQLIAEDAFQAKKIAIQADYQQRSADLAQKTANIGRIDMFSRQAEQVAKYNETMNKGISLASGLADAVSSAAEQGSAAWVMATLASKAMMIAQTLMAANLAAVQAAANTPGGPAAQMAAASSIQTWGYAQAAMIAAQGIVQVAGAREKGGGVEAGKTYLVGERGPELFTAPGTGGQITSNANLQKAIGGGGGDGGTTKFEQHNTFQSSGMSADDVQILKDMTSAMMDKKIQDYDRKRT